MQELSALVVPTADQIERPGKSLEDGTSFESRFVQKIKKQCNNLATYQGVFVATPNGLLLAGSHEAIHDARKVEKLMRRGLEKWGKLSPAERLMTKDVFAKAVAELADVEGKSQYPHDGLVLSVVCRDLPRSPKPSKLPQPKRLQSGLRLVPQRERRVLSCPSSRSKAPSRKFRATSWKGWPVSISSIWSGATRRPFHNRPSSTRS